MTTTPLRCLWWTSPTAVSAAKELKTIRHIFKMADQILGEPLGRSGSIIGLTSMSQQTPSGSCELRKNVPEARQLRLRLCLNGESQIAYRWLKKYPTVKGKVCKQEHSSKSSHNLSAKQHVFQMIGNHVHFWVFLSIFRLLYLSD